MAEVKAGRTTCIFDPAPSLIEELRYLNEDAGQEDGERNMCERKMSIFLSHIFLSLSSLPIFLPGIFLSMDFIIGVVLDAIAQ